MRHSLCCTVGLWRGGEGARAGHDGGEAGEVVGMGRTANEDDVEDDGARDVGGCKHELEGSLPR